MKNKPHFQNQPVFSDFKGILIPLIFAVAVIGIYAQVIDHEFVIFDDHGYVTHNTHVKEGLTLDGLLWAFHFTNDLYWHPMTWMSHMLDVEIFGMKAGGHLMMNVFLHFLNTFGLFILLKKMTGSLWRSAFVAALFAVHPLNVESVAWIAARKNLLSTFFWILTVRFYLVYCERMTIFTYLLALSVFILGLMSKPMLITLPFVLLLFDFWPLKRFRPDESGLRDGRADFSRAGFGFLVAEKVPFLLLSGISIFISILSVTANTVSFDTVPLSLRVGNAAMSYIQYLLKFVWPLNIAVYYPFPTELAVWQSAGAGLILAAMTLAIIRLSIKTPYLTVGWLWYLGTLVPVIGIIQAGLWPAMADRWAYIPLIGIYIIIAWGSADLVSRLRVQKQVLATLAAAVLCFFTVTSWWQVKHWQNSTALFSHALAVTGANTVALNNLGNTFLGQGQTEEAIAHFTTAIELNPRHARALNNLGVALAKNGDSNAAVAYYRKALQVTPAYAEAHNNLGAALRSQGKYAAAIAHYTRALQIKPRYDAAHYNLGLTYLHTGRISLAVRHFRKALVFNPHNIAAKGGLHTATKMMHGFKSQMPSHEMTDSITSPIPNRYDSQKS